MSLKSRLPIAGMALSVIAGLIASLLGIGREARLVDALTIYFAGAMGGASLAATILRARGRRGGP